ncbi:putative ABC transporter ATP-binding protein YbhF [Pirellulimonas nuda]|uniref:Putative ABC transporter ATP-binding protein YbhF n=1 Tax=Pirellulimonas nuda TaxID=2528009 RepID=A0A518D7G0_9BACT|nr:ABC transporter ATP-binding protein [Pirellulimonas nuda]QDU87417.1 putative ABC transporter ATP-binding protein YbhF [Pirellulimonas nuda]
MLAIRIADVRYRYGDREALCGLSLDVAPGETVTVLGPNGSGKSTLFRLISTLMPMQQGEIDVFGCSVRTDAARVRGALGVVFQSPSLDKKLTVRENLRCHAAMYGLGGLELKRRIGEMLGRLKLEDRAGDRVETLSGGLKRRVELAKGMLHEPRLLVLDEPSTGLDPAARSDLWRYLGEVSEQDGVTVVATSHLLEEAERADRIAIVHQGQVVACDTPTALKSSLGGDAITLRSADPKALAAAIEEKFNCPAQVLDGVVRLEQPDGHQWASRLFEGVGDRFDELTIGKPTLEDVFIARTGHRFFAE